MMKSACEPWISAWAGKCKDWPGLDSELTHPVSSMASTDAQETASEQGVFRGVSPSFPLLSPQPPALLAQVFLEWPLPTDKCAVVQWGCTPWFSLSSLWAFFFRFLAVTISCSKKFHHLITGFVKCHFLLFAARTGISRGSRCFRRWRDPPNAFNALFAFVLVMRVLQNW